MRRVHVANIVLAFGLITVTVATAQQAPVSRVWQQFVEARQAGAEPPIPDFSFAGYANGAESIPDIAGPIFNVTDFGATPDDGNDDQDALQAAIDAAAAAGGGVVFLPAGAYHVNTDISNRRPLTIHSSNIILRGSGMHEGGTIILIDQPTFRIGEDDPGMGGGWLRIEPRETSEERLTTITADAPLASHMLEVEDASGLSPGMWISVRAERTTDLARAALAPYELEELPDGWTRIREGINRVSHHRIAAVEGNRITLREPLSTPITADHGWFISRYTPIEQVGIEDISFQGGWVGKFSHHRSHMDDNGWEAVRFNRTAESWIRRCAIVNFNTGLSFESSAYITAIHNIIAGQMGHSSIGTPRRCTGILVGLSADITERGGSRDTPHGIGNAGQGNNIVYWRFQMAQPQSWDFHGMWPHATLFDMVVGGDMNGSGGPVASFPNHAENLVVWNFRHEYEPRYRREGHYSFWGGSPRPSLVKPIIVGMHGVPVKFDEQTVGILEHSGTKVEPESLWEAQLELRLGSPPDWVDQAFTDWEQMSHEPAPFPRTGDNTPWVAEKREQIIRLSIATPMVENRFREDDWLQGLIDEWPTVDGSPWPPIIQVTEAEETGERTVRIAHNEGEQVHYTTDGSDPTEDSQHYTEPIRLPQGGTIKAIAIKEGHRPSFAATKDIPPATAAR